MLTRSVFVASVAEYGRAVYHVGFTYGSKPTGSGLWKAVHLITSGSCPGLEGRLIMQDVLARALILGDRQNCGKVPV